MGEDNSEPNTTTVEIVKVPASHVFHRQLPSFVLATLKFANVPFHLIQASSVSSVTQDRHDQPAIAGHGHTDILNNRIHHIGAIDSTAFDCGVALSASVAALTKNRMKPRPRRLSLLEQIPCTSCAKIHDRSSCATSIEGVNMPWRLGHQPNVRLIRARRRSGTRSPDTVALCPGSKQPELPRAWAQHRLAGAVFFLARPPSSTSSLVTRPPFARAGISAADRPFSYSHLLRAGEVAWLFNRSAGASLAAAWFAPLLSDFLLACFRPWLPLYRHLQAGPALRR